MLARLGLMLAVAAVTAAGWARTGLWSALRLGWRWLRRGLTVVLALIVVFAEWGWRPLVAILVQLGRLRVVARLELWLRGLPPYGALAAFLIPSMFLLPLKILALYFLAHGMKLAALGVLAVAKIGGTAVVAHLFILMRTQLMRIGWFARAYNRLMPWKEALFAQLRASWAWRYGRILKAKATKAVHRTWTHWRPAAARTLGLWRYQLRTWLRWARGGADDRI